MFLERTSIRAPSAEHKVLEMGIWKSESTIVVRAGESPVHGEGLADRSSVREKQ